MSYGIKTRADVAPDADKAVHALNKIIPCVIRRWAVTQKLSITEQLQSGIRYFDLRISLKPKNSKFYFVHGLYCEEVISPLNELNDYLSNNPDEFVILDCQHFYNINQQEHSYLMNLLKKTFDTKIYGRNDGDLKDLSLNYAKSLSKQIIIIYRYNNQKIPIDYWPGYYWPTPWPNEIKIPKLKKFLEHSLDNRQSESGFVTQCVLTPSVGFIIPRFLFSLRKSCARPVFKKLSNWIENQVPGPFYNDDKPKSNVFLADFIEIKNSQFCKMVIELNNKININSDSHFIDNMK